MTRLTLAATLFVALTLAPPATAAVPRAIAANPARTADAKLDSRRKGWELLAFDDVRPSQKICDLIPGAG